MSPTKPIALKMLTHILKTPPPHPFVKFGIVGVIDLIDYFMKSTLLVN